MAIMTYESVMGIKGYIGAGEARLLPTTFCGLVGDITVKKPLWQRIGLQLIQQLLQLLNCQWLELRAGARVRSKAASLVYGRSYTLFVDAVSMA